MTRTMELKPDIRRAKYLYHHNGYDLCMEFSEFSSKYFNLIGPDRCDYISCEQVCGNDPYCAPGGCPHYGNCLPVEGIRNTPKDAIGKAINLGINYERPKI